MPNTNKSVGDKIRQWLLEQFQRHCTKLPREKRLLIAYHIKQIIDILKTKEV